MADLAFWYGWGHDQLVSLDIDDFVMWLEQMTRQIKAGYRHGAL